jgi:hypothetical protein
MLSERRDEEAATAFFKQAINNNGFPDKVVMDKSGANYASLAIRFIHPPRSICFPFLRGRFYSNGWRITDNPTIERSMININPSFFHNFFIRKLFVFYYRIFYFRSVGFFGDIHYPKTSDNFLKFLI